MKVVFIAPDKDSVWQTDIFSVGLRHSDQSPPTCLTLLTAFSASFKLCGFDINFERI